MPTDTERVARDIFEALRDIPPPTLRCSECGRPDDELFNLEPELSVDGRRHVGACDLCCEALLLKKRPRWQPETWKSVLVAGEQPGVPLYGVELEVDRGWHPMSTMRRLNADFPWLLTKHDGSLADGFEVVTQPMSLRAHLTADWKGVISALKDDCWRSDCSTCGLHVHISNNFTGPQRMRLAAFVHLHPEQLTALGRRGVNACRRYAAFVWHSSPHSASRSNMEHAWERSMRSRYHAVNMTRHSTVELRFFRGTLVLRTLLATVEFCDALRQFVVDTPDDSIFMKPTDCWHEFCRSVMQVDRYKWLPAYMKSRKVLAT